jgi:NAD(P)-dependent dehydrogenase (short-subunit alcohol dehydrogenase family)
LVRSGTRCVVRQAHHERDESHSAHREPPSRSTGSRSRAKSWDIWAILSGLAEDGSSVSFEAFAVKADVSQDVEARRLVEETGAKLGRLDVLVNNAGWSKFVPHRELGKLTEEILSVRPPAHRGSLLQVESYACKKACVNLAHVASSASSNWPSASPPIMGAGETWPLPCAAPRNCRKRVISA